MHDIFKKDTVFIRSGGSIPIVTDFQDVLKIPSVMMGFGLPDDNLHAPNEKFHIPNFHRGIESICLFFEKLGKIKFQGFKFQSFDGAGICPRFFSCRIRLEWTGGPLAYLLATDLALERGRTLANPEGRSSSELRAVRRIFCPPLGSAAGPRRSFRSLPAKMRPARSRWRSRRRKLRCHQPWKIALTRTWHSMDSW